MQLHILTNELIDRYDHVDHIDHIDHIDHFIDIIYAITHINQ